MLITGFATAKLQASYTFGGHTAMQRMLAQSHPVCQACAQLLVLCTLWQPCKTATP
jgi:hypothetical protein